MTCDTLHGYVSEIAKNCIPNPSNSEMCEVCVSMWNNSVVAGLIVLAIAVIGLFFMLYIRSSNEKGN